MPALRFVNDFYLSIPLNQRHIKTIETIARHYFFFFY